MFIEIINSNILFAKATCISSYRHIYDFILEMYYLGTVRLYDFK